MPPFLIDEAGLDDVIRELKIMIELLSHLRNQPNKAVHEVGHRHPLEAIAAGFAAVNEQLREVGGPGDHSQQYRVMAEAFQSISEATAGL